ncbi:uncharacterized protein LOC126580351 [Anopheles aquasalis]|uniref:uncharacterized protein LOC126580351 n=1 Tax=Anopheles aquasalis TaxID=42839 RepID=UPI00215A278D|nr:uncharacterized protein LOC126580351 [Anopheles aquasalis]
MPERTLNNEPLLDDQRVKQVIMDLSQMENRIIESVKDEHRKHLLQQAQAEVIGGFLHEYFLPLTKYAYYSGVITQKSVKDVLQKTRKHESFVTYSANGQRELDISRLNQQTRVLNGEDFKNVIFACHEIPKELPIPITEMDVDTREIFLITLPLQNNSAVYNPKSTSAHRAFLHYYLAIVACNVQEKASVSVDGFNKRVSEWISINLENIFAKGTTLLYPAFESILRIHKTLSVIEHDTLKKMSNAENHFHEADNNISNKPLLYDTDNGNITRSSTIRELSIWIGFAMAILLVVYVVFRMRRNHAIISANQLTKHGHRRTRLHQSMSDDEEITMYNRLEDKVPGNEKHYRA